MARADKATVVAELTDHFSSSSAAVLTEYRGLTVAQLQELRSTLGGHAKFAVAKNTLAKIAAKKAGVSGLDDLLQGPTAIAFVKGDVVEAAKGLRDFAKANPLLVIKGGVVDGKPMTPAEITKLADLESREVLLAKLAGAMKAKMAQAAATSTRCPPTWPGSPRPCAPSARRPASKPSSGPPGRTRPRRAAGDCRSSRTAVPIERTKHRRNDHHGEAQQRGAAGRLQGDDPP